MKKVTVFDVVRDPRRAKEKALKQAMDFARKRATEAKRRLCRIREREAQE